jgi:hypothetical protein
MMMTDAAISRSYSTVDCGPADTTTTSGELRKRYTVTVLEVNGASLLLVPFRPPNKPGLVGLSRRSGGRDGKS